MQNPEVEIEMSDQDLNESWEEKMSTDSPPNKETIEFDEVVARHYLSPYLLYQEQERRICTERGEASKMAHVKESYRKHGNISLGVEKIMKDVGNYLKTEGDDFFRGGELKMCGSVAEGTKVSSCDEFDYQYLITLDNYKAIRKPLLRTKPRSSKIETKAFYSIFQRDLQTPDGEVKLSPCQVHDSFRSEVGKGLVKSDMTKHMSKKIVKAGPAVKIVLWSENYFVKIDLTFGVKSEPLKLFKEEELTDLARSLPWDITLDCHFICAHDYWRVSFVDTEQQLMREISQRDLYKAACYRAIKCVRDQVDVKDQYGDGILPSYPIKITFMDIALQDSIKDDMWSMEDTSIHAINVLEEVVRRGQSHQLNDLFLKGDEVMSESDRSYLESRRILQELKNAEKAYFAKKHFLLPVLICTHFITTFVISWTLFGVVSFPPSGILSLWLSNIGLNIFPATVRFFSGLLSVVVTLTLIVDNFGVNQHLTQPLYKCYSQFRHFHVVICLLNSFEGCLIILMIVERLLQVFLPLEGKDLLDILDISFVIMIMFSSVLPVLVTLASITFNAGRSIHLKKDLVLFDKLLSCTWKWEDKSGIQREFIPQTCGSPGFTKVTKLRAYLVVLFAPLLAVLSLTMFGSEVSLYYNIDYMSHLNITDVNTLDDIMDEYQIIQRDAKLIFTLSFCSLLLLFLICSLLCHQQQNPTMVAYLKRVKFSIFGKFSAHIPSCLCCFNGACGVKGVVLNYILTKIADVLFRNPEELNNGNDIPLQEMQVYCVTGD
ncbi:uncharacterized protein LOC135498272 [Lineus longissimus]|uniref:uncharacterized protein LOC135498272 n=1 Tax=Lineus longissimus TaxID=88925 RepID=UPI00315D6AB6